MDLFKVKTYDLELSKVKSEKAKVQDTQARQEDQCRKLHDKVEALAEKNRGLMLDNDLKQRQVAVIDAKIHYIIFTQVMTCVRYVFM